MPAVKKISEQNNRRDVFNRMMEELELGSSPVDFQLPTWLKKRKPFDYTFIKRNVYLIKRVKKRIEDDGIFCSCSPSPGSSSVCDRDCHCGMLLSSCSTSCKCGNACLNKPFQQRKARKLKLVQTERCGSGLVADEDIKRGEFVIEYVGEVIDDETCEERLWKMKHRGETNFYLCEINRDMVIDATFKGNKSRFINHSCQPNTEMQKWRIDGETRIGIFATRDIKKGDDLTYDYHECHLCIFLRNHHLVKTCRFVQFGADQDCYCGALGCRRKLGTKPSNLKRSSSDSSLEKDDLEEKEYSNGQPDKGRMPNRSSHQRETHFWNCIGEFVQIWRPCEQRFIIGCIKHFNSSSREHTILSEDRSEIVLDLSKEDWDFF